MATILITFIPHFEPEIQTFSDGEFQSRPKRLLAAALKQWMFANDNAPDEIIAIGVRESCWSLLREFEFVPEIDGNGGSAISKLPNSAKPNTDGLEDVGDMAPYGSAISKLPNSAQPNTDEPGPAKPKMTQADLETLATQVGQRSGIQIEINLHEADDDDTSMFERVFSRLMPLDQVVIDTTHGPVGLWAAFALLEKESHLHEVVFQGFYGGRLGATDSRFSKASAPDSTRGRLALLNLVKRLETQPLRNYARDFKEFEYLEIKLRKFDEAVRLASPAKFDGALHFLNKAFFRFSEVEDPKESGFGRRGQAMIEALAATRWDVHVLEVMWKKNDPLLFSRWAVTCLTNLSLLYHPLKGRDWELWSKARELLQNDNTTLAQWMCANGAPIAPADMSEANGIIERFATQAYPEVVERDLQWMTSFLIRFQTAHEHVERLTRPIAASSTQAETLAAQFEDERYLDEAAVVQMMFDVCTMQRSMHARGWCFGSVAPEQIREVLGSQDGPRRFRMRWVATKQEPMKLPRISPYMSPEEVRGFGLTPASDIASLGLVALSCLRKSPVFGHEEQFELLEQIRRWQIPDWSTVSMSPALRNILVKCLHKDPSQRFATAEALRESLLVNFGDSYLGGVQSM